MNSFKTLLRKIKYNFKYLYGSNLKFPSEFRLLIRKDTSFQKFINQNCKPNTKDMVDLNNVKIFGKPSTQYVLSNDIFTNYKFSNKKLKPAYFNTADVKVPYEASRLQYLQKAKSGNIDINNFPLIYWNSPMDVAIRNINLIFHLFAIEDKLETPKILGNNTDLLSSYISEHYEFVINNLENKGNVVGNHYLVELTSILLTIATFSFEHDEEDFQKYQNELNSELDKQFYEDGTNFEGSSHYAAFVVEALIVCKLAIEEIDRESQLLPKIEKIIKTNSIFLKMLMNNGELTQIGDNDSGRLFYFAFDEDAPLQMIWLINLIDKLYPNFDSSELEKKFNFEIKSKTPSLHQIPKVSHKKIKVFTKDYEGYCFNNFGLYVWRNDEEYLSLRCGPIGQNGIGGHSHYDQLSIECYTDNRWIARDPGTGTYTDDIKIRNSFRSLEYHWGPKAKIQIPKEDEFDCFKLNYMGNGHTLIFNKYNYFGYADFNGKRIYRKIIIHDGEVLIEDFSNDVDLEEYTSWGESNNGTKILFSNGYKRVN